MQRVIGITKDKYIDTDLDTLLIHFSDTKQESYVYEYDVPEEFPYIIFLSKKANAKFPSWIEIVNPKVILEIDNVPLHDLGELEYNGNIYTIKELICKLIN